MARFFDLMPDEVTACMDLINEEKKIIDEEFNPDGYNIQLAVRQYPISTSYPSTWVMLRIYSGECGM